MTFDETDLKRLRHDLKDWSELTDSLCEWFSDIFKEQNPSPEMIKEIQALVKKFQWDNGTLSSYVIPEIDSVH